MSFHLLGKCYLHPCRLDCLHYFQPGLSTLCCGKRLIVPVRSLILRCSPTVPPLQEGEWSWTGDLYLTTSEPIPDDETTTKEVRSRACEIVIRGLVLSDDTPTKVFKSTFKNYIQGKITISGAMDLNLSHAIIASGALEPTQAAWMTCKDQEDSPEWELWDGLVHKMEQFCWVCFVTLHDMLHPHSSHRCRILRSTPRAISSLLDACCSFPPPSFVNTDMHPKTHFARLSIISTHPSTSIFRALSS